MPHIGWCVPSITYVHVYIPYVQVLMTWYVPIIFQVWAPPIYTLVCVSPQYLS